MQNINVNIVPDNFPQTIRYSQGDIGRQFKINVADFDIPVGATVKIQATKPSGFGFSVAGVVSDNSVTFTTTEEMTDEAGRFQAELQITSGGDVIGTANFLMIGERNPHPEGTTDGSQGTIIPELTLLVERVEKAASDILDMEVVATTLPAGSQATYSYDEDLNKATFGIPEGQAGAGAAGVVASAYSAAKTYKVGDYVLYNSNLYRCTTAITTAEAWTAAHWTQIVLADDVTDLKTDFNNLVGYGRFYESGVSVGSGYYKSFTKLKQGVKYKLEITPHISGLFDFNFTTAVSASSIVDTIASQNFVADVTYYFDYTPSADVYYARLWDCTNWDLNVYLVESAWEEIEDIEEDVDTIKANEALSFDIVQTSQMFNKDEVPDYLYVKSNKEIVSNDSLSRSWIIPVEPSTRYVAYVTQTLEAGDGFGVYLSEAKPIIGGYVERVAIDIMHSKNAIAFTTNSNEHYALIGLRGNFANLSLDVARFGIEQIDDGLDYKNEPYGKKSILKSEITDDNISTEIAQDVLNKGGLNKWLGKKIWWCGTSIPHGEDSAIGSQGTGLTYPEMVGKILGATVYNEAEGSSMARANVRTGNYVNAMSYNLLFSLSQTTEEKQYLVDNWSTIRQVLNDPNTIETVTGDTLTATMKATFEERLMPYLDGTKPMPDLFVFDHGHNDWKSFYTMPDGTTPDTELEPTVANISNSILAEDTYMTANSNAKLISFFGEINGIPSAKRADFIASVNRNCFIGAINFLCTLILSKNPRARIVFIGNLDNWNKPQVQLAQEAIADSWEFPLVKMWEYLGFSEHYIPNTATYWDESGTTDLTVKQIYCKDGVHPHSDTTGDTLKIYSQIIADALMSIA